MKVKIYHHNDEDGWASAAVILTKYPEAECTPCYHGEQYELVKEYDEVFVVDFTFSNEEMNELKNNNKHFTWIDHHASAIEKIVDEFEGVRREGRAACALCWDYFYPNKKIPQAIEFIAGFDVWDFSKEGTKEFILFLQTKLEKNQEPEIIKSMIENYTENDYNEALEKGKTLRIYQNKITQKQVLRGVKQNFLGIPAMVYFANSNNSELGNEALQKHKDIDIAVIIDYIMIEGKQTYKYSLRSRNKDNKIEGRKNIDVSKIAMKFDGGGHPSASGFQSNEKLWER